MITFVGDFVKVQFENKTFSYVISFVNVVTYVLRKIGAYCVHVILKYIQYIHTYIKHRYIHT
jgi:hypothetical protein